MKVSRIRNTDRWRISTLSSRRQISRPATASLRMKASSASESISRARRAISTISGSGAIGRLPGELLHRLGDVDGMIADALDVVGDLQRGGEHAEVARHRLLQGEEVDDLLLDLHLERVDLAVSRDHGARLLGGAFEQRFHREVECFLGFTRTW